MSGVWSFDSNGVYHLDDNPVEETSIPGPAMGHKVLVHKATNTTMTSYEQLENKLYSHGWYPYARNEEMRQYHRGDHSVDLITLPAYFSDLRTTDMYDVVVKTRSAFEVRDAR